MTYSISSPGVRQAAPSSIITVGDVAQSFDFQINPSGLAEAVAPFKKTAKSLATVSHDLVKSWSGLTDDNYKTPEAPALRQAMPYLSEPGTKFESGTGPFCTALTNLAAAIIGWNSRRSTLASEIAAFTPQAQEASAKAATAKAEEPEGADSGSMGDWRDDPAIVARNNALWGRLFTLEDDIGKMQAEYFSDLGKAQMPGFGYKAPSVTPGKAAGNRVELTAAGPGVTMWSGSSWDGRNAKGGAGVEGQLFQVKAGVEGSYQNGSLSMDGGASISIEATGSAKATYSVGTEGVHLNAEAKAFAGVKAEVHGNAEYGIVSAGVKGKAMAGAEASATAKLDIGANGLNAEVGASAFAGAKAEAEASVEMMGVEGTVGADVRAGIGVDAKAGVKVSPTGEIKLSFDFGVAVGVGAGVKGDISINPKEALEDLKKVGGWFKW